MARKSVLLAIVALLWCASALAHPYKARVDIAVWNVQPSPLICRMWQPIPTIGEAVFEAEAGRDMTFYIDSLRKIKFTGDARLESVAPAWKYGQKDRELGKIKVQKGGHVPFYTDDDLASQLLAELQLGMFPRISYGGWYPKHTIHVDVSSVNFITAYNDFVACMASLYPANFDQLERTRVLFDTDKWNLKDEFKDRFFLIKGYVDLDPDVIKIYIDGHTDNRGSGDYNWDLSKKRAETVLEYMTSIGIPDDMIVMRYHGEQYPVEKNDSKTHMQKNRRVTVRLERERNPKLAQKPY